MISFKYGVILGAILIICIYFTYKSSTLREGISDYTTFSTWKNIAAVPIDSHYNTNKEKYFYACEGADIGLDGPYWTTRNSATGSTAAESITPEHVTLPAEYAPDDTIRGRSRVGPFNLWHRHAHDPPNAADINQAAGDQEDVEYWLQIKYKDPTTGKSYYHSLNRTRGIIYPASVWKTGRYSRDGRNAGAARDDRRKPPGPQDWSMGSCSPPPAYCTDYNKDPTKGYKCQPSSAQKDIMCPGGTCNKTNCCYPTCDTYEDCPQGTQKSQASTITCSSGTCDPGTCCNPTCDTYQDCAPRIRKSQPSTITCSSGTCDPGTCCNPTCDTYQECAQGTQKSQPSTITCSSGTCDPSTCCNPTCDNYGCKVKTWSKIPNNSGTTCGDNGCDDNTCCQPTCASIPCQDGWHKKDGIDSTLCQNKPCKNEFCCEEKSKCSSLNCENIGINDNATQPSYHQNNTVADDYCKNNICGPDQCCSENTCEWAANNDLSDGSKLFTCDQLSFLNPESKDTRCGGSWGMLCNSDNCCSPNPLCGASFDKKLFTCDDTDEKYFPESKKTQQCGTKKCTSYECCADEINCGSIHGQCKNQNRYVPDPGRVCDDKCDDEACCEDIPTCVSWKGCDANTQQLKPDAQCIGGTCKNSICCDLICASHPCTGEWEDNPNMDSHVCEPGGCTNKYCCKKKTACSSFKCENTSGYKQDPALMNTPCDGDSCSVKQCCAKMTCAEMVSANQFSCKTNYSLDPNKQNTPCGSDCDNNTCCIEELQCASFMGQCEGKRHVDDKNKYCPKEGCSDDWCCIDNPYCRDGGYACTGNSYVPNKEKQCLNAPCTPEDCCVADPICGNYTGCDTSVEHIGDMSKPCLKGTCLHDNCCVANAQCGSFVGGCDPGKHVPSYNKTLSCDNNSCSDEQCCEANAKCGQFDDRLYTCLNDEYIQNPNKTCNAKDCTHDECCVLVPTCSSYTCSSLHLQHINDPSTPCPNGVCSDSLCCEDNIRCSSFECPTGQHSAGAGTPPAAAIAGSGGDDDDDDTQPGKWPRRRGRGAESTGARCLDNICDAEQCCIDNQRCLTYACDNKHTPINQTQLCNKQECTEEECCEPNATCSGFSCGTGFTMKSKPAGITCTELTCSKTDCCIHNETCGSYDCRAGQTKIQGKGSCNKIKCTNKECCQDNPRCSSYTCESSYYKTKTLVHDADNVICNESECKESECCDVSASGKLPKINMWPIYD